MAPFLFRLEVAKVDLIPEERFRELAPPELQLKGDEDDPQHTLLLNRLQFELHQRKEYPSLPSLPPSPPRFHFLGLTSMLQAS